MQFKRYKKQVLLDSYIILVLASQIASLTGGILIKDLESLYLCQFECFFSTCVFDLL